MKEEMKLTKAQNRWVGIIKASGGVAKCYNPIAGERFFIPNSRRRPSVKMVKALIDKGALQPVGDGLFGDTQMFRIGN